MSSYTPGPWSRCDAEAIVGEPGHGWFVRVSDKRVISVEGRTEDEADSNAHLIAAAPDLYEALNRCREALVSQPDDLLGFGGGIGVIGGDVVDGTYPILHELLNEVEKALAKARGES